MPSDNPSEIIARELGLEVEGVRRAIELIDAAAAAPFLARYRRDETGGLDEEQLAAVIDARRRQQLLTDRKQSILRSLEAQGRLGDPLREAINRADSLHRLDDLYLPYKPKQPTPGAAACDQGLGPLAEEIMGGAAAAADLDARAVDFINEDKQLPDAATALAGAGRLLAERFSEDAELRRRVRRVVRKTGKLTARRVDGVADKKAEAFKSYFDYREPLDKTPPHRVLAINRGERAGVLRVGVDANMGEAIRTAKELLVPADHPHADLLSGCIHEAVTSLLMPTLEQEARRRLNDAAEAHSLSVFGRNLRNLLLGAPLAGRRILAIDPGYQNGCHLAVIDPAGAVSAVGLMHLVGQKPAGGKTAPRQANGAEIAPAAAATQSAESPETGATPPPDAPPGGIAVEQPPEAPPADQPAGEEPTPDGAAAVTGTQETAGGPTNDDILGKARGVLVRLIDEHPVDLIVIGNGKACRPAEELVSALLGDELKDRGLEYLIVSEAGASVYASSTIGREELPDIDAGKRGAVSIGRRVQDPLAELVKIDPASVGVGLYQHDVKSKPMRQALEAIVASCVARVGVDANRAGPAMLRYVPGLNPLVARRLCEHREKNGALESREQIKQALGLSDDAFSQAAGFLRVVDGSNPLDATWVHPEHYPAAEKLLEIAGVDPASLSAGEEQAAKFAAALAPRDQIELAAEVGVGPRTLEQIIDALTHPGRDPRDDATKPTFRRGVVRFEDLSPGSQLDGTVLNVVDFGAFVDVGLSDSGLLHISRMGAGYVADPHAVVSVGDRVRVWVDSVDAGKRRVSLSMIEPGAEPAKPRHGSRRRGAPKAQQVGAKNPSGQAKPSAGKKPSKPRRGGGKRQAERKPAGPRVYESRAKTPPKPLTKEMEEGKEAMRTFGDLLQFHKKKSKEDGDDA